MSPQPVFSVIIPTWNRPKRLAKCLGAFLNLDYPAAGWELIVVNDGGERSFAAVTDELNMALPMQLLEQEHSGPAAARNFGSQSARGKYLAFTDDDCCVYPDWLARFEEGFSQGKWDALGGRAVNPDPTNLSGQTSEYFTDFLYGYYRLPNKNAYLLISNNASYRRSVFHDLGGFDKRFPFAASEDRELSHRLVAYGYRQSYWPKAQVWHHHAQTWWKHIRMQFRYGRGDNYFRRALADKGIPEFIGQPSKHRFPLELSRCLWRDRAPFATWLLLACTQLAYKAGSQYEGPTRKSRTY